MAFFRLDRARRAGPYLEWKVAIFAVGAVLGLAGIWLDEAWMRIAAIVVLAGGMLLRYGGGGGGEAEEEDDPGSENPDSGERR